MGAKKTKPAKLTKSRWLMIEALTSTGISYLGKYAVAYITDKELEELFFLLDDTAKEFIKKKAKK